MSRQSTTNELLVAVLKRKSSLDLLKDEHWYHIPIEKAPKRWPPKLMAFYQGSIFGPDDARKIRYFGEVNQIDICPRKELFPNDKTHLDKSDNLYYRLQLNKLEERAQPIISYRPRVVVFITTTLEKFNMAGQINDLFDDSPLEDELWKDFKRINVLAERQWKCAIQERIYFLDFAIFCKNGKLAVETDGYTTHYESTDQIDRDIWRQNEIQIDDWRFLHYTSKQIRDERIPYLAQIQAEIDQLGGPEKPEKFHRKIGEEVAEYVIDEDDDE